MIQRIEDVRVSQPPLPQQPRLHKLRVNLDELRRELIKGPCVDILASTPERIVLKGPVKWETFWVYFTYFPKVAVV